MQHQGSRIAGADYFDDYAENDAGILKGMGLNDYDRVTQTVTEDGVLVTQLSCRGCGRKRNLTISWEEMFYVANNGPGKPLILPDGWARSDENMDLYVQMPCSCGNVNGFYAVHFSPDEARKLLAQAAESGLVNQQMVAQWAAQINRVAGRR